MAPGHGGAQEIELGRVRDLDLREVIGGSGHGAGGRGDVASRTIRNSSLGDIG